MYKLAVLLAALALLAAGCGGGGGGSQGESEEGSTQTIAGLQANDHGTKMVSQETEVELDDNYFDPTVLEGNPGEKVKLELKNEGSNEHNFTLASQNIDQDVEAGEDANVTVTIPQSGQISFFCKYHKTLGMAGALEAG
jgi:plastocyanin